MRKTLVTLAACLVLTACGTKGADPEASLQTLHNKGLDISMGMFEKYGEQTCDMAEAGNGFETMVDIAKIETGATTSQAQTFVWLSIATFCPDVDA